MDKPLIIYFNDEKMINSVSDQSNFLKKIKVLAKNNSLQVTSLEDFITLLKHLPKDKEIFVFIHIMGDALGGNINNGNYEYQGKSWAVSLRQEYPNCNFHFVTSNLACANEKIWDDKSAYNITDLMDSIFVKKSNSFKPQSINEILISQDNNQQANEDGTTDSSKIDKPKSQKPKIFIGSSVEGLKIARSIQTGLHYDAHVTIWENGVFDQPGKSYIEILEDVINKYEYGIFVFTPDDKLYTRNKETNVPRDNVIFEYGMFLGKNTRANAFYIVPRDINIHIMTDVLGLTCLSYDPTNEDLNAAVSVACNTIREAIRKQLPKL
jgi:predicted nucleotide-binding protein